ncbi:MAG: thioesterase family protein [Actinomycetota bacterium]|nr:thioesterase family protein [Actinomycetota bacterium]
MGTFLCLDSRPSWRPPDTSVNTYDEDTAVERTDDFTFVADLRTNWWLARGPHGGYLASVLLRAMTAVVADDERAPRSLTVHYLRPPAQGRLDIDVSLDRRGRNATFMSCAAHQEGKLYARALAAFSHALDGSPAFDDAPMPDVRSVEDSYRIPHDDPNTPPFLQNFDIRWAVGEAFFSGAPKAEVGGWIRTNDPHIGDAIAIATYMDAFAPAAFPRISSTAIAPTMDLTIHFRSTLPLASTSPEDLYLGVFSSTVARDGFFEEDGNQRRPTGRSSPSRGSSRCCSRRGSRGLRHLATWQRTSF